MTEPTTEELYRAIAAKEGWLYSVAFGQFHRSVPKGDYNQIESCFPDAMCFRLIEKYDLIITPYIKVESGERIKYYKTANWLSHQMVEDKDLSRAIMLAVLEIDK